MLLWLKYLKELEAACGAQPPGGAGDVKTMCEDEEWGNESEAMPTEPRTPSSLGSRGASSGGATPESRGASPAAPPAAPADPPRLRLNPSLATDPALAPRATPLKREPRSPSPPPTPAPALPAPTPTVARDYLAAAAAAFPGLFPAAAAPGYVCKPCGIRYSSLSTLQAHQEHYCSNRRPKPVEPGDSPTDAAGDDSSGDSKTARPPGKQYACAYCSYSADKKVSLNRHMRMHSASPGGGGGGGGTPAPAAVPAPPANGDAGEGPPAQDRYCADCDIRFSSVKTYRAHKTHYCSTRQVVKGAGVARASSATSGSAPPSPGATPPAAPQPQYALALPTTPILILPIGLLRAASTLPGATLPDPDAPCFLLPNGTFQPLTQALPPPALDSKPTEADVLKAANRARDRDSGGGAPLDLSVRRSPEAPPADDPEKENRLRSATPEQIVCAPSLPGSPASATPSPRRSCSPSPDLESEPKRRRRGPTPRPGLADPLPAGLSARLAADPPPPAPALSPKVLVKQGVSKCMECNVVFCSHENYRIHKRLYCPARGEERASPAPAPPDGRAPYRQLICLACGIHFSSLDNLTTHQTYYCAKRETRSPRGGGGGGGGGGPGTGGEARPAPEGWKCPCCEVVSPTAAAAQRHMEAHAGVRGFRCTICRYRGNTLRGMRTHIRMHFNNKKPADLQEESYIACVVEEESREGGSPGGGSAGAGAGGERVHRCTSCAYSSTYRGNVVRHARLVHAADEPDEESPPPPAPAPAPIPAVTPPEIKKEPIEEAEETPNYCKSCDISFKYVNTYIAHKQFYCTANAVDAAVNNNVPAPAPPAPAAHRLTDTPLL